MLLGRGMPFSHPLHRPLLRLVVVVGGAVLLTVSASACSTTGRLTTGMKVRNAVVKLGESPSASVIVSVDGSTRQARDFLSQARGEKAPRPDAVRLAQAEVTVAAGSGDEETPLKEMSDSDAADVAAALNFGGRDVLAVKSVRDRLYLRVSLRSLVRQTESSKGARRTASEIVELADELPYALSAAKAALTGRWVKADPEAFDEFARAAETLAERGTDDDAKKTKKETEQAKEEKESSPKDKDKDEAEHDGAVSYEAERSREIRDAVTIGSALDGQSQREFVSGVQELLRTHAKFEDKGEHDGADHVRMTLPGREAADDLVAALRPLGAEIDPDRVPKRDVTADLDIRRGQLTILTLDLGQFTRGGGHLPLRMEFSSGHAVSVRAPSGAKKLKPQDLVAALMYGALGTGRI
jgi:hypothetical protein